MSADNTSNTSSPPPRTITPMPSTIMETTEQPDIKPEVEAAIRPATPGSVVVLSDDNASRYSPQSATASSDDRPLIPRKIADAKEPDANTDEQRGTKRPASAEAQGEPIKKAKTNEEGSAAGKGKKVEEKPKKEETIPELKEKANAIIAKKIVLIKELREKLAETEAERHDLEEDRDKFRAEKIILEQTLDGKASEKKTQAARENEWRNNISSKIKAALQEDFAEKLKAKSASVEKRLKGVHDTAERKLQTKLDAKTEKLEETLEALRDAKDEWKIEVQELKAEVNEGKKHGGAKAREAVKELKEGVKAKDKEIDELTKKGQRLSGEIIHLKAKVNAAETQHSDMNKTYMKTCEELKRANEKYDDCVKKANAKVEDGKKKYHYQFKDNTNLKAQHANEIKSMQAIHAAAMRELDAKWSLQANNSAESQQRVVEAQRKVFALNNTLTAQSNQNEKLMDTINDLQMKLKASAAEKRKKDEENSRLLNHLAQSGASPIDVLKSTSSASSKVPGVESRVASQSRNDAAHDFGISAPALKADSVLRPFPPNPFQRAAAALPPRPTRLSFGAADASQVSNTASSGLKDDVDMQDPPQSFGAPAEEVTKASTMGDGNKQAAGSIFGVKSGPATQEDSAVAGKVGGSANQYSTFMGGEPGWTFNQG